MKWQRGDGNDVLFTMLTGGAGLALLVAAFWVEAEGRGQGMLLLGGFGGVVAAGRHQIAALVAWLLRRRK